MLMNRNDESQRDLDPESPAAQYDVASLTETIATSLTDRQRHVLGWVATGATNHRIAQEIGCGQKTIESDLTMIYSSLGVASRIESAVIWALVAAFRDGSNDLGGHPIADDPATP